MLFTPKTPKSNRVISIPESLKVCLREYIDQCYSLEPDDRLFPYTKHFLDYELKAGCDRSGVKRIRVHDIRHSHVAALIEMNIAPKLLQDPRDYDARAELMWAGSLSHNGLTGFGSDGGDWMTHKLEHEIGGLFDVAHGAGLAAIWGSWARYVYKDCLARFRRFAVNVFGVEETGTDEEIALKGIEACEAFFRSLHMPTNLRELGIDASDSDLETMARKCAAGVGGGKGAAKFLREADMLEIYRASR